MPVSHAVPRLPETDAMGEPDSTNSKGYSQTTILPHEHGLRLDAVLARLLPQWGLRARRRLCEQGHVLLNGRPGLAAVKTRAGQRLEWRNPADCGTACDHEQLTDLVELAKPVKRTEPTERAEQTEPPKQAVQTGRTEQNDTGAKAEAATTVAVVCQSSDFAALYKPVGLHSAALAGSAALSLEGWMHEHLTRTGATDEFVPRPVNRLDRGTSGLVLAVCSEQGLAQWTQCEAAGTVDKRYLALVMGLCTAPMTIRTALRTADRKITRPCNPPTVDPDPLRHTHVTPLGQLDATSMATLLTFNIPRILPHSRSLPLHCSLVGCRIRKGARHQIRVHLALQGFALWGDPLYGASPDTPDAFFLHHGHLALANFAATVKPQWLAALPIPLQRVAADWLAAPTVF